MGLFKSMRDGVKALGDKRGRNSEIDEELEAFMGESISEKMRRGMSLKDAEHAARVEMGSADVVKHKVWNAGWESMAERVMSDVRYTLRRLARRPGLVFVVVLSIAIGIAANATVFSLVSRFLLQRPPVGEPDRVVMLARLFDHGRCCNNLPLPVLRDVRAQQHSFTDVTAYDELVPAAIGNGSEPVREWGQAATAAYFDVLQMKMAAGRGFLPTEEKAPVIVLGYGLWQQQFGGDAGVVGRTVKVSGHVYTVVGVAPKGFRGVDPVLDAKFWVPLGTVNEITANSPSLESRTTQWLRGVARLKPGVTREKAEEELKVISARLEAAHPATEKDTAVTTQKLGSLGRLDGTLNIFLLALSSVAFLVLLMACANVANLLLAQAAERQREMAVRLSLGATRAQLLRQLLLESLLLSVAAGGLGVLMAVWATRVLSSLHLPVPVALDLTVHVDWHVMAYAFSMSVVAGLVCGFVPAWSASRPVMPNALKGEDALARPGRRWSLRGVLVVMQITLSLILLCGSGLFLRSLQQAAKIDTGFRSRGVVMMAIDPQLHRYTPERAVVMLRQVRERMKSLPGVVSATVTDGVPLSMGHRSDGFDAPGRPKPQGENVVEMYMASPEYFETMGIPLLSGRGIGDENPAGGKVAVVNEEFVKRYFQGESPIGHIVTDGGVPFTIVGVAKDTKSRTLGEEQRPVLYRSVAQSIEKDPSQDGYTVMVRYDGDASTLMAAMEHEIHAVDPQLAIFNTKTMEEHMQETLFLPRVVSGIFLVFGVSGVLLAAIGLYGVMSYTVSRRTKEIGVRMAMGARATQVQAMFVGGGMRLALVALLLGLPLALAAAKLTGSLLYGIKPWDTATFTVVPVLLALVALAACWIPSRRAARVDPMEALRVD
ncbi:MAG TPA: ABC transporter permease [Edaphobacter sp.]